MNCPSCKNPVQENASECEWCGSYILKEISLDYYKILGIKEGSSLKEIRLAYRKKVIQFHPDRRNSTKEDKENFELCAKAFEIITNSITK